MKTTKKDECSYSFSNAVRTLAMVRETGLEFVESSKLIEIDTIKSPVFQGNYHS